MFEPIFTVLDVSFLARRSCLNVKKKEEKKGKSFFPLIYNDYFTVVYVYRKILFLFLTVLDVSFLARRSCINVKTKKRKKEKSFFSLI